MTTTSPAIDPKLRGKLKGVSGALAAALALIGFFEGTRTSAYRDIAGVWTICQGITQGVHAGQVATQEQCDAMDSAAAKQALKVVDSAVKVPMSESRRAALADFVYNVGEGNFEHSTLLKKLNAGDTIGACNELKRWVYVNNKVNAWQVKRRATEQTLCLAAQS